MPTLAYNDDTAFTYVDVTADDNVIVALYSARDRRRHGGKMGRGQELHVFSWDERLIHRIRSNSDLQAVGICPVRRKLLRLTRTSAKHSAIVEFASEILQGPESEDAFSSAIGTGHARRAEHNPK